MEIFVFADMDDVQSDRMREIAGEFPLHIRDYRGGSPKVDPAFLASEIVYGNVPPAWLPHSDSLRWVQLESVGFGEYRELDWGALGQTVTITNLAGFFSDPVAESALAGILALYRGVDRLTTLKSDKRWDGDSTRSKLRLLTGANVLLFGYGSIGQRVAELLAPFRCQLTCIGSDWTNEHLDGALASADVVVCAAPETDHTVGVFDKDRLAGMKSDALFVNFGRGSVVDENALVSALNSGSLGGAVIDVTTSEPLPDDHPLWDTPNTILSQHTGGGSNDETGRKIELFADNFRRFRSGQPLVGIVDFERGY